MNKQTKAYVITLCFRVCPCLFPRFEVMATAVIPLTLDFYCTHIHSPVHLQFLFFIFSLFLSCQEEYSYAGFTRLPSLRSNDFPRLEGKRDLKTETQRQDPA